MKQAFYSLVNLSENKGKDKGQRQRAKIKGKENRLLYSINVFNYRVLNLYVY
jgi:hypothetical protein